MTASYPNNLAGHIKEAIAEWESIEGPTKGLAETIVSNLHYHGYSYSPAKEVVADTFERAAHMAQYTTDTYEEYDRDTCEFLANAFLVRASALRKTESTHE